MIVDLILRKTFVGFSLLPASDYYHRKGIVCYVLLFDNQYIYGDLSILVLFILLRGTHAEDHFLLFYFSLQQVLYFIMFYL